MAMTSASTALVADIRAASRDLVRQLGFMNRTMAGTDLSPSAVHALIEIGIAGALSSKELSERLLLEKSTVSRMVKSLVERGELEELRSGADGRVKHLRLTARGRATLAGIDRFAEAQVAGALAVVADPSRQIILQGLRDYAKALRDSATAKAAPPFSAAISLHRGYAPTLIGRIAEMFIAHMNRYFGFDAAFERRIVVDMAEFFARIDAPANATWRAEQNGRIIGSITIDGEDLGDGLAHLRWFIVDEAARGANIGDQLLSRAVAFCDERGYREIQLWTVKGLNAARALYERYNFHLAEEFMGDQWGTEVTEQKFVRRRGG